MAEYSQVQKLTQTSRELLSVARKKAERAKSVTSVEEKRELENEARELLRKARELAELSKTLKPEAS